MLPMQITCIINTIILSVRMSHHHESRQILHQIRMPHQPLAIYVPMPIVYIIYGHNITSVYTVSMAPIGRLLQVSDH